jgi:hypothetical protein
MEPIFNRNSRLVGWLRDDKIFDNKMKFRAFVRRKGLFALEIGHIDFFMDGIIRDRKAGAVAFLRGNSPGPMPPTPSTPTKSTDTTWNLVVKNMGRIT